MDKGFADMFCAAKEAHPNMVLLFEMGDFYKAFGEDAGIVSRVLGLTLCSVDGAEEAGFPNDQLGAYLAKLLNAGYRVAVCDQIKFPHLRPTKGLYAKRVIVGKPRGRPHNTFCRGKR